MIIGRSIGGTMIQTLFAWPAQILISPIYAQIHSRNENKNLDLLLIQLLFRDSPS